MTTSSTTTTMPQPAGFLNKDWLIGESENLNVETCQGKTTAMQTQESSNNTSYATTNMQQQHDSLPTLLGGRRGRDPNVPLPVGAGCYPCTEALKTCPEPAKNSKQQNNAAQQRRNGSKMAHADLPTLLTGRKFRSGELSCDTVQAAVGVPLPPGLLPPSSQSPYECGAIKEEADAVRSKTEMTMSRLRDMKGTLPIQVGIISELQVYMQLHQVQLSLDHFLVQICGTMCCSKEVLIVAMVYFDRYYASSGLTINSTSELQLLLLTSIVLATKYQDGYDHTEYTLEVWAKVGMVPTASLAACERSFARALDWRLFVTEAECVLREDVLLEKAASRMEKVLAKNPRQP